MFRIAMAGVCPANTQFQQTLRDLLTQIIRSVQASHKNADIFFVESPYYTDPSMLELISETGFPVKSITSPALDIPGSDQMLCLHTNHPDFIGENLCADVDMVIAAWDESPDAMDGAILDLLRMARRRKLPCIWVSERTGKVFWPEETLFMPFSEDKLDRYLQTAAVPVLDPASHDYGKEIPFLGIGMRLQSVFLKKYKAAASKVNPVEDYMLRPDYRLPDAYRNKEPLRKRIIEQFSIFDQAAIALNNKYQAVVYWQAILPFIITCFLAVGFYTETIFGAMSIQSTLLKVLAGIGFLMNAYLNLYKYRLDRSKTVRHWRTTFAEYRGTAELLRVLAHFIPFGLSLDLLYLCGDDPAVYRTVREIISDTEPGRTEVGQNTAKEILLHLKEMVDDQLSYHKVSEQRYAGVVRSLSKWSQYTFFVGFIFVFLRAVFNFVTILHPVSSAALGYTTIRTFSSTFANMLAMLLPAWAAYFSSKLSQCNYFFQAQPVQLPLQPGQPPPHDQSSGTDPRADPRGRRELHRRSARICRRARKQRRAADAVGGHIDVDEIVSGEVNIQTK